MKINFEFKNFFVFVLYCIQGEDAHRDRATIKG